MKSKTHRSILSSVVDRGLLPVCRKSRKHNAEPEVKPKIEVSSNAFKITLPNRNVAANKAATPVSEPNNGEKLILEFIGSNGYTVRSNVEQLFDMTAFCKCCRENRRLHGVGNGSHHTGASRPAGAEPMQGNSVRESGIKATKPKGQTTVPWANLFLLKGKLPHFLCEGKFPIIIYYSEDYAQFQSPHCLICRFLGFAYR